MNILTFDIEEWYLQKTYFGNHADLLKKYDYYLDEILNALDRRGFKGTFFCVGGMATDFPEVVRKIERRGHEIGCHSFRHVWLNKMSAEELYTDTRDSIDALEQCIGKKICSYRAPAFSVGRQNKWALEILGKCSITRDASIYPAERDFGGFSQFTHKKPVMLFCNTAILKEFPICTTTVFGNEMAYSGGGFFRFFPLSFIRKEMAKNDYNMAYFHINDLIPETSEVKCRSDYESYYKEPGTLMNRYKRYFKTNVGKKGAFNKLLQLLESESFVNLEQADNMIDWQQAHSIVL